MKNRKHILWGTVTGCAMLTMILDSKTALLSAQTGLNLCIKTVIPALFPFFVLSGIINSCLIGQKLSLLRPFGKLCKIPNGGESLLLIGFLAGYPVGAQLIAQAYQYGQISKATAHRMLGFCNNAGPAFLFGMLTPLFTRAIVPWILWGIHMISALMIGYFLPQADRSVCSIQQTKPILLPKALQNALKNITTVCGWVILFRVIIGFCERWFFWWLPKEIQILFSGFLELSNGIMSLHYLSSEGFRFIFASAMLAFGGLCVGMQTTSVTDTLGSGLYFPGKILHCLLSTAFSLLLMPLLFKDEPNINITILPLILLGMISLMFILLLRRKKVVAFA